MDYKTLLETYKNTKENNNIFYDTKKQELVKFDETLYEALKNNDMTLYKGDDFQKKVDEIKYCLTNRNRFIPFETVSIYDFRDAKVYFEHECKDKEVVELSKSMGYDEKGIKAFSSFIDDSPYGAMFLLLFEKIQSEKVSAFILRNDLKEITGFNPFRHSFTYLKKISKLAPWKIFREDDVIKMSVQGKKNIYISFLGHNEESYGLFIFDNDHDFSTFFDLIKQDPDSVLVNSLMNSIACDFSEYRDLSPEERVIINRVKGEFEDGFYPSLNEYKEGLWPRVIDDYPTLNYLNALLRCLYQGLLDYYHNEGKYQIDETHKLLFNLTDYQIELSSWNINEFKPTNDYGLSKSISTKSIVFDENKTYEVKIDIMHSFYNDGYQRYFVYNIIVMDDYNKNVLMMEQTFLGQGEPLAFFKKFLIESARVKGFAKHVKVANEFIKDFLINVFGSNIDISVEETSFEMEEVFSIINNAAQEEINEEEQEQSIIN